MGAENRGVYIIQESDPDSGDGWITPTPVEEVIADELLAATDLDRTAVESLSDHVDFEALAAVLAGEGGDAMTFTVADYTVTVDRDGAVAVTDSG